MPLFYSGLAGSSRTPQDIQTGHAKTAEAGLQIGCRSAPTNCWQQTFASKHMATTLIEELAIWDVELEQITVLGSDAVFRYGALLAHLNTLYRLDLIDDAERRERHELADAAYAHAVEEAQRHGPTDRML